MSRKIEILTNDGSPLHLTMRSLWGDAGDQSHPIGVGGAETALLTLCEAWHDRGDTVILYNDPWCADGSPFEQRPILAFNPSGEHDIVIFFRSPPIRHPVFLATSGLKIWWSTDQQTVGDFKAFSRVVDKIVCISPFHAEYFANRYGITNTIVIDLPVRVQDFENLDCEKVPHRVIFTSVPARGLDNLERMWRRILREVPDATLVITSDYRLWGVGASNEQFRAKWMRQDNVMYYGALKRADYLKQLSQAQLLLYPSNYEELFCIAAAEAQVAGCQVITSATGALPTTNMGTVLHLDANDVHNDVHFVDAAVKALSQTMDGNLQQKAIERFNVQNILDQWDKVFE